MQQSKLALSFFVLLIGSSASLKMANAAGPPLLPPPGWAILTPAEDTSYGIASNIVVQGSCPDGDQADGVVRIYYADGNGDPTGSVLQEAACGGAGTSYSATLSPSPGYWVDDKEYVIILLVNGAETDRVHVHT